jgi:hypothetical protein
MKINNHSHKPEAIFYGQADYHFGLEIESYPADWAEDCQVTVDRDSFFGACPELVYVKMDGSLQENGFEIVTHPMSLEFLQANKELFETSLKGLEVLEECGMHVHVSRSAFSDKWHLYRVIKFVSLCAGNDTGVSLFKQIAGREFNHFCQPMDADSILAKLARMEAEENGIHSQEFGTRGPRHYDAVNIQNKHTVEFRMFNGTVDVETIINNVMWVKALIEFMRERKGDLSSVYEEILKFKNFLAKTAEFVQLLKLIVDSVEPTIRKKTPASLDEAVADHFESLLVEAEPPASIQITRTWGTAGDSRGMWQIQGGRVVMNGFLDSTFENYPEVLRYVSVEELVVMSVGTPATFMLLPVVEVIERLDGDLPSLTLTATRMIGGPGVADRSGQAIFFGEDHRPTMYIIRNAGLSGNANETGLSRLRACEIDAYSALVSMGWDDFLDIQSLIEITTELIESRESGHSVDHTFFMQP